MPRVKRFHSPHVRELLQHMVQQPPARRIGRRHSARIHSIRKFGRTFMDTFPEKIIRNAHGVARININFSANESGIAIATMDGLGNMHKTLCGHIKIGFEPEALIVEAIQGHLGIKDRIDQVTKVLGKPWANYSLGLAEEHARKCGLKRVKIASPRTNYWFEHPEKSTKTDEGWKYIEVKNLEEKKEIQKRMLASYAIIARKMGYKKQGEFYVKEL